MVLIGATPKSRNIEQHDIFFGIAHNMAELIPAMTDFWPEAKGKIHVDAWREVKHVNGYKLGISSKAHSTGAPETIDNTKLYFLNLGGYKPGEFEEYHYKMVLAAPDKATAMKISKQTAFFKHMGYKGATAHIDDKYGIDIDDMALVKDILTKHDREKYRITLTPTSSVVEDELHIGYFKLDKL